MSTAPAFLPSPEQLALCGLTGDDFRRLFLDLLPQGYAWSKYPGTIIYAVFDGAGQEPARVAGRDCALLAESYPCGAVELLPDWERICGLPDECTEGWASTLEERQAFVCAKLAEQGGQSRAYYIALAETYGFVITIEEHFPWRMGCTTLCDAHVGNSWFWWTVHCADYPTDHALLECVIRRAAPVHTVVNFVYVVQGAGWNVGRWNLDGWT